MKYHLPEEIRQLIAVLAQWGGWMGAMALGIYSSLTYDPTHGRFAPAWVNLAFIFLVGVALGGTAAMARIRMTRTLIHVFQAGHDAATHHRKEGQ